MNKDDMIAFSLDNHTVEPPDMVKDHLSKEYVSRITRNQASVGALRRSAEGHDVSIQARSHGPNGSGGPRLAELGARWQSGTRVSGR